MSTLSSEKVRIVQAFVAAVAGDWARLRSLAKSAPEGEPNQNWREALLMIHLFAGVPRQIEAFETLYAVSPWEASPPQTIKTIEEKKKDGAYIFESIYGELSEEVHARIARFSEALSEHIIEHVYGTIMARPGLDLDFRELLAVTALTIFQQDRQLASHARGAIRAGATFEQLEEVLRFCEKDTSPKYMNRAKEIVARFARRA